MEKIGILTFHRSTNFGSLLQTYGLYKKICDLGYNAEIIDYRCEAIEQRENIEKLTKYSIRDIMRNIFMAPVISKKLRCFQVFLYSNMQISKPVFREEIKNIEQEYKKYIVGSDIVWGRDITNHDNTYFLDFVSNGEKKYAFASSVGNYDKYYDDKKVGNLLADFSMIAVREQEAVSWVKAISNKDSVFVCDPTMLLNVEEWEEIITPYIYKKRYALIYFPTEKNLKDAEEYAKKNNIELWVISYGKPALKYKTIRPTSLEEFLGLIKYADTVFTASYHGMLFSLYYNKNFYFYTRAHSTRVLSLAAFLGVLNRCGDKKLVGTKIDYEIVNKKMNIFRENSISTLRDMLK